MNKIFGVTVSQEELLENGITCSICREDMQSPIKLSCSHIFCEECVSEWCVFLLMEIFCQHIDHRLEQVSKENDLPFV